MTDIATAMTNLTNQPWFAFVDMAFHLFIIVHVVRHICEAGKRLHQWVHVPLRNAWQAITQPPPTIETTSLAGSIREEAA